jgi:tetratricopeptide (TPR) repeat protein
LLALADGDQLAAAQAVREATTRAPGEPVVVLALVASRYRSGDLAGAGAALEAQPDLVHRLGAARTLGAALQLDREKPDAARAILKGSDAGPPDALTLVLVEEASRLQRAQEQGRSRATAGADAGLAARAKACAQDGQAAPSTGALCLISDATALRLAGDRAGALSKARQAAALPVTHPRTLGSLAQLLANLGEIDEGAAQSERAARFASPAFPALAWANVAIAIGRGKSSPPPAGIPVAGSEARVIAARAQVGAGKSLTAADDVDPDLRLLSSLGMRGTYHQVIRYVESLAKQPDRSPVASYVGGELAMKQGRRHLAARLLGEALSGHGDSCQAARDYQEVLRRLKQSDRFAADVAPLAKHNSRCVLKE